MDTHPLWVATGLGSILVFLLAPRGGSLVRQTGLLLAVALAARLLLLPHPVSDDVYRYLWEGRVLASGVSPYQVAPEDGSLRPLRDRVIWPHINHPDRTACDPPLMILTFRLLASLWYHPLAVKLLMLAFDMGTVVLLLFLLQEKRLPLRYAWLYALNPLVLYAFAAHGHLDTMQTFFLCAGLLLYQRKRWHWMWLCLALAVQVKYMAALAIPFFLNGRTLRSSWVLAVAVAAPLPVILPKGFFDSLLLFGSHLCFNGFVHTPVRALPGEAGPATMLCVGAGLILYLFGLGWLHPSRKSGREASSGILFALGLFLIFSPTIHFWYLAWVLPFALLRRNWSWFVLTLTAGSYVEVFHNQNVHQHRELPPWVWSVHWLPFGILLAWEIRRWWQSRSFVPEPVGETVSVIVPTKNEGARIHRCIASIRDRAHEIIVADGGSNDGTWEMAAQMGCRVVHCPADAGRGGQLVAGAREATGDILLLVHADTCLEPTAIEMVRAALQHQPDTVGGAIGTRFTPPSLTTEVVGRINEVRACFFAIAFGDQLQFVRRKAHEALGLIPDQPLMEDVELSLRMRSAGKTVFLWGTSPVSARRWQLGSFHRTLLVVSLVSRYLWQRLWSTPDTVTMYREYYGTDEEGKER